MNDAAQTRETAPPTLRERYALVRDRVAEAARASGRRPDDVLVVAVSKYHDIDQVRALVDLGHRDFGESQAIQLVQRAAVVGEQMARRRQLSALDPAVGGGGLFAGATAQPDPAPEIRWHMVGHLQRNKVKKCVGTTRLIHSVDSLRLVDEIHAVAFKKDIEVELLVQVNTTNEPQKFGCAVAAARHLCEQIDSLVHLRVRGLMCMGPASQDLDGTAFAFERARELFDEIVPLKLCDGKFNILSMGMSGDYELAIRMGANMVRLGSAIFGPRPDASEEADAVRRGDVDNDQHDG